MRGFIAVALACGLALAGVAHAQDASDDGMECVYNELIDVYDLVAEDFIYGDVGDAGAKMAVEAVESAKASCAARYSYTSGQLEIAGELGVLGSALDYLSEDLLFGGVSEAAVDGILDAYDTFTDDDVDSIFDPDWRSDATFYGQIKAKLLGAGIPDEADLMDIAMTILEIAALVEEATILFVLDE